MTSRNKDKDITASQDKHRIGGGPGASDANSGGGNASGVPDAETAMRAGDATRQGDVNQDRDRLFPPQETSPDGEATAPAGGEPLKRHGDKLAAHVPIEKSAEKSQARDRK